MRRSIKKFTNNIIFRETEFRPGLGVKRLNSFYGAGRIIGLLLLIIMMIFLAGCEITTTTTDPSTVSFDETYEKYDYFVFDYPGEWYESESYKSSVDNREYISVKLQDDRDYPTHFLKVRYYIDHEFKDRSYNEFYNRLKDRYASAGEKGSFKSFHPAYEVERIDSYNTDRDYDYRRIYIFENDHEQLIRYRARKGSYNNSVDDNFFCSFEFK